MIATDTSHQVNIDGAHMVVTHGRSVGLPEPESVTALAGIVGLDFKNADDAATWCDHISAGDPSSLYTYSVSDGDFRKVSAWGTVMGTRVSLQWSEAVEVAR